MASDVAPERTVPTGTCWALATASCAARAAAGAPIDGVVSTVEVSTASPLAERTLPFASKPTITSAAITGMPLRVWPNFTLRRSPPADLSLSSFIEVCSATPNIGP
jgi:hypothetical protein